MPTLVAQVGLATPPRLRLLQPTIRYVEEGNGAIQFGGECLHLAADSTGCCNI